jgi:hypothetical protein
LLDEGKAYVRAEARLAELKVRQEVGKYQRAAMFAAAAVVFAIAALVALSVTAVLGFAHWIGPWGGGLVAVIIFAAVAFGLAFFAKRSVERIDD